MTRRSDPVVVVGAGIVGLATALGLRSAPDPPEVVVLEKEPGIARHQSGHNSGVVHSGPYYPPGSLKARLCTEGRSRLLHFLDDHRIRYERCGKVIAAVDEGEVPLLREIYRRGVANGVPGLRFLSADELREMEPSAKARLALHVPTTAIVDYREVSQAFADELRARGGEIIVGSPVTGIRRSNGGLEVGSPRGTFSARYLVNCAGLQSDRVARLAGATPPVRIVPFLGEYRVLRPERRALVRGLLYPVPDPGLPFLGVHLTRRIDGSVEAGPNALLALSREGYRRGAIDPVDVAGILSTPGLLRMALRIGRPALLETYRSLRATALLRALQRLLPALGPDDLLPGACGVRAQAVSPDGRLVDDFVFVESDRALHVLNAPSPAATASLSIGRHIAARVIGALAPRAS